MQLHEILSISSSLIVSNCCLIQLVFNYLSIGCAGFAILNPIRPFVRMATIASILSMLSHKRTARTWLFSTISLMLLVSQDMLALHNKSSIPSHAGGLRWPQVAQQGSSEIGSTKPRKEETHIASGVTSREARGTGLDRSLNTKSPKYEKMAAKASAEWAQQCAMGSVSICGNIMEGNE